MTKNPLHYFKRGNFYFTQYTKLQFHIHKIEHLYITWLNKFHFPNKAVHWPKNTYKPWGWNICLQFEEFEIGLVKGGQFYWSTKLIFKAKVCGVLWNHKKFSHKIIKSEITIDYLRDQYMSWKVWQVKTIMTMLNCGLAILI
jgi:hypothetical protein